MNRFPIKYYLVTFALCTTLPLPKVAAAQTSIQNCSPIDYTILTINGIFTDEDGAIGNRDALWRRLPRKHNNENLSVKYLHNPSHLGGIGDMLKVIQQGIFDSEKVRDHDLVEMIKTASAQVHTQKLLLVAHSQGNFYANSFYGSVAGQTRGVPKETIGVYGVASPSSHVAGNGKWITSDTDKVIAGIVKRVHLRKILQPNTHIELQDGDDFWGHDFSGVYLEHQGNKIVSDINYSLNQLASNNIQDPQKPCLAPPKLTIPHKIEGVALAVLDPVAQAGLATVFSPVTTIYRGGVAFIKDATRAAQIAATATQTATQKTKKAVTDLAHTTARTATKALAKVFSALAQATPAQTVISSRIAAAPTTVAPPPQPPKKKSLATKPKPVPKPAPRPLPLEEPPIIFPGLPTEPVETVKPQGGPEPEQIVPVTTVARPSQPTSSGGGGGSAVSNPSPAPSPAPASTPVPTPPLAPPPGGGEAPALQPTSSSTSFFLPAQGSLSLPTPSSTPNSPLPTTSSTPPEAFFTAADAVPDTFIIDLAWYASSTATSTPFFDVQVSWDDGATWLELASSTENTELRYETTEGGDPIFRVRATDSSGPGAWTANAPSNSFVSYPKTVVINEIAPIGTGPEHVSDEWIELFNTTGHPLDLAGWTLTNADGSFAISLAGTINPYNYFMLEQGDDQTLSNIPADQIYTGALSPLGEDLLLKDASGAVIDRVKFDQGWPSPLPVVLMRGQWSQSGSLPENWAQTFDGFSAYAKDRDGTLALGTPAQANHAIMRLQGTLTENLLLPAELGPYEIIDLHVPAGTSLTIELGTVIRFPYQYQGLGITVESGGAFFVQGTPEQPIIFTAAGSARSDNYYERTNPFVPSANDMVDGDWGRITFEPGSGGALDHTIIRYGQRVLCVLVGENPGSCAVDTNQYTTLVVNSDAVKIAHTAIEKKGANGITVDGANPSFEESELPGITVRDGSPTIKQSELRGGNFGMWVERGAPTISESMLVGARGGLRLIDAVATLEGNTIRAPRGVFLSGTLASAFTLTSDYSWVVVNQLKIPAGTTMTVGPGTWIGVDDNLDSGEERIVVNGRLLADGTPEARILITDWRDPEPNSSNLYYPQSLFGPNYFWGGIKFENTTEESRLVNAVVRYAGSLPYSGGVDGSLQNSVVVHNASGGFLLDSVVVTNSCILSFCNATNLRVDNGAVEVRNSRMATARYGVRVTGSSTVLIDGTNFKDLAVGISSTPEAQTTLTNMTLENFTKVGTPVDPPDLLSPQPSP